MGVLGTCNGFNKGVAHGDMYECMVKMPKFKDLVKDVVAFFDNCHKVSGQARRADDPKMQELKKHIRKLQDKLKEEEKRFNAGGDPAMHTKSQDAIEALRDEIATLKAELDRMKGKPPKAP